MKVGGEIATVRGTFEEVAPEENLAFTWQWDGDGNQSLVSIAFSEESDGSRITLTHKGLEDEASKEKHNMGWVGSLTQLSRFLG